MKNPDVKINSGDEIVIVIPEDMDDEEIVIDLDELGIDVDDLDDDINVVVQVEGSDDEVIDDDFLDEPNEWYWDDDPYRIVYYEFPPEFDDEE